MVEKLCLRKSRNENGFTLVELAMSLVFMVIIMFAAICAMSIMFSSRADDQVKIFTTEIATGLVTNPNANNIALVDKDGTYYIYLWKDGDEKAYESDPIDIDYHNTTLTGTPGHYTITLSSAGLLTKEKYVDYTVSVPGYGTFTREVYDATTLDKTALTVYDSATGKITRD